MFKGKIITGCWEEGTIELKGIPKDFILSARELVVLEEKEHKQLQTDLDKAKEEKQRLRSGLGVLIQNWISVQKISDENYTEESDVILSNAQQALKGGEEWQEDI